MKDLKQAAKDYSDKYWIETGNYEGEIDTNIAFDTGANWMKEQMKNDLLYTINHTCALYTNHQIVNVLNPLYQEQDELIEKLKTSLDNLRKLL